MYGFHVKHVNFMGMGHKIHKYIRFIAIIFVTKDGCFVLFQKISFNV